MNTIDPVLAFISQAGDLMQMPRTHKKTLGTAYDTIASHSFMVAIMSYCLARMENVHHDKALKCMAMGLIHDIHEARTGDVDFIGKQYNTTDDTKAIQDQYKSLSFGADFLELSEEYEARTTTEARITKDADRLTQIYTEWVLMWQGNKLAENWFKQNETFNVPYMYTTSAKKLYESMKHHSPHDWWYAELLPHYVASAQDIHTPTE